MEKILVICHLKNTECNGQVTKTKDIISFLQNNGFDVDVFNYGNLNPISKFLKSRRIIKKYKKAIIMPGGKRALFFFAKLLAKRKVEAHYVVVGGWVLNLLCVKKYHKYFDRLRTFKGIYLQNMKAVNGFEEKGFKNIFYISNFSSRKPIQEKQLHDKIQHYFHIDNFKFCFFARVTKEKGVLLAIDAIINAHKKHPQKAISLDIYGETEDKFITDELARIAIKYPFINVKGSISGNNVIEQLSTYYCLLFPSFYHGEGTPHSIIEAFMAGLPVIASDWAYNSEIVINNYNGIIFQLNTNELNEAILWSIENPEVMASFSKNAFESSKKYTQDTLKPLLKNLSN